MADIYALPQIGALTVQTATKALQQGLAAIETGHTVFDLAGVKTADSAAVAVLLEWQRCARRTGNALSFINVPRSVCSLARLYGVDGFLVDTPADNGVTGPGQPLVHPAAVPSH